MKMKSFIKENLTFLKRPLKFIKSNYARQRISSKTTEDIFTNIYKTRGFGGESLSGPGSDLIQTRTIRQELPKLFKELKISSILDIPCGDFFWLKETNLDFLSYIGADIVDDIIFDNNKQYAKKNVSFIKLNILKDKLPKTDLIICRDLFVHFSFKDISAAINNIISTNSKYILNTSFASLKKNKDILTGEWRPLNLLLPPFLFPNPIQIINENCQEAGGKFSDKSLLLWEISSLKPLNLKN